MAPPVEPNNESTAADPSHRSLPTPFLTKTYQLVDDNSIDDIISWNDDGSTFIVWRPAEFARDLLPKYFKHNNFSSFVRQLNTYGFRKIVPDRWEFANDCFRRGEKHLLCDIHRRKISPAAAAVSTATAVVTVARAGSPTYSGEEQVLSSNSSPAAPATACRATTSNSTAELLDENERLRKENMHLTQELTQMKNLCNSIFVLMTKYANSQGEGSFQAEKPLDLMPLRRFSEEPDGNGAGQSRVKAEEETSPDQSLSPSPDLSLSPSPSPSPSPRLFGVPIGVKRLREEDEGEKEHVQPQQAGSEIKSEPLESSPDHRDPPWLKYCPRTNQRVCN